MSIRAAEVPVFTGVLDLVKRNRSGGMVSNEDHFGAGVDIGPEVPEPLKDLLFDPQTSGGLLVAVDAGQAEALLVALIGAGLQAAEIGLVLSKGAKNALVR